MALVRTGLSFILVKWRPVSRRQNKGTRLDPRTVSELTVAVNSLSMEEATKINVMTDEEEPDVLKTQELLSQAQVLMTDIEELLDRFTSRGPSNQTLHRTIQQEGLASIQEDGETVIIAGFRFESAASREDLRRLEDAQDGAVVSVTPAPKRSNHVRGNNGRRRARK